ncbi:hypothetical protein EMPG_16808 [Blastomyces silverae]|uniref:Rhodopsin domain-containing protein n=1 Tax=Blastomyces silverae TaxID=2060906 RepID=A0A0H1B9E5_9EURO|nr:hypothetical protein EMPG_16808 [Blastomyces silverae]
MAPERHVQALVVITVFPAISLVLFALRIFSRYLSKNWGWDDVFVTIAMVLAIGMCATSWGYTIHTKQGYPPDYFPPGPVPSTIKGKQYTFANQLLYFPILTFVRASIIAFILSLSGLRKYVVLTLRILFVVNLCAGIAIFLANVFQCRPVHYAWDSEELDRNAQQAAGADENGMKDGKLVRGGSCLPHRNSFLSMAMVTIILDAWLLSIPSIIVWGINMPRRQKFMVVIVLSIGAMVTAFSIVRAVIVVENFSKTPRERIYDTKYTYANIETNCAIWAAATPALKSLIARQFPRWWETRRSPYTTSSNHLPHASSLQTSTPPLAGSLKGSQVASSNDPQSHPLDSLPPLRRIDDSEVELRRFEYDPKVSGLFRTGQNYIPEDQSSNGTMAMHSGSSNRQASPDSKLVLPPNGSHFGSSSTQGGGGEEEGWPLSTSPTLTTAVQSAVSSPLQSREWDGGG